ncbi:MAG: crosslink repair DNA glycosylase YcaQ family protein [Trebonia sp.]|jgi:uncharacterized protein YcaQ
MAQTHRLSRPDARRIAVRAQFLAGDRPADLLTLVRRLTTLQLDPVSAIAPSADLVAWSKLGSSYRPEHLLDALADRRLIELRAFLRPAEDIALYRAAMAAWAGNRRLVSAGILQRDWVAANDRCRRDILDRLRAEGPLPSRAFPDTCDLPWESTGWTNNKNVIKLLDFMVARGEVAVAGRKGRDRLWDLAGRVYPDDPVIPAAEAEWELERRRLAALGIARLTGPTQFGVGHPVGEPAVVEGIRGEWRVDPAYLDGASGVPQSFATRAALLSPFDWLVYDRVRAVDLFGFEYLLEMYKPAAKRRWGYYALPILCGDQLAGKLDATADRKAGLFTVNAIHQDIPFTADMADAIDAEIASLAAWLNLDLAKRGLS